MWARHMLGNTHAALESRNNFERLRSKLGIESEASVRGALGGHAPFLTPCAFREGAAATRKANEQLTRDYETQKSNARPRGAAGRLREQHKGGIHMTPAGLDHVKPVPRRTPRALSSPNVALANTKNERRYSRRTPHFLSPTSLAEEPTTQSPSAPNSPAPPFLRLRA